MEGETWRASRATGHLQVPWRASPGGRILSEIPWKGFPRGVPRMRSPGGVHCSGFLDVVP
jgi:hypothetical protein